MLFSNVNEETKLKVKNLKMEFTDKPQPELLICVPNPNTNYDYTVKITNPDYTSLCPLALTQPDFAIVFIEYIPDKYVIELKSIKFYIGSYRNVGIFHEAVATEMLNDLVKVCQPKSMSVKIQFSTRGGIDTTVEAHY